MFRSLNPKLLVVIAIFSLLFTIVGFGAHAYAADYADVNRDGWRFYADGQNPARVIAVLNGDSSAKLAVFSSPKAVSGFEVRLTQQPDYYNSQNNQPSDCKPARIVVQTSNKSTLSAVLEEDQNKGGCGESPVQYGTTDGVNVEVGIPADIAEIAKLQNNGKYPYICPGFSSYPGNPTNAGSYNCPDGTSSVQNGVLTDSVIGRTTTSTSVDGDSSAGTGGDLGMTDCETNLKNPVSWFVCPVIDGLFAAVRGLDSIITTLLIVDTDKIFNTGSQAQASNDINVKVSNAYYSTWSTFRNLALGLVVIASLVIIIASAFGFEILDAYTIKKALPRVFIAVVGIALSWEITYFFISLSNDVGVAVRGIIYAPFEQNLQSLDFDGGDKVVLFLAGAASILVLGMTVLTFAVGALVAVIIAAMTMILREMFIIFFVIIAPVAVVAFILPNTQKYWQLYQNTFTALLIAFPIISAFIALGRVFSAVAFQDGAAGTINTMIAFVAYFLPYFMIPFAFKFAGGILSTISGIGNDKSRGIFDRMRKSRQNATSTNMSAMKNGGRFNEGTMFGKKNIFASGFNRSTRTLGAVPKAGFDPRKMRSRMGASTGTQDMVLAEQFSKESPEMQAIIQNDDFMSAGIEAAGDEKVMRRILEAKRDTAGNRIYSEDAVNSGVATISQAWDAAPSSDVFNTASLLALPATGTAFKRRQELNEETGEMEWVGGAGEMHEWINKVAGGDRVKASRMLASMRSGATQARRFDLGGGSYGSQMGMMEAQWRAENGEANGMTAEEVTEREIRESLDAQGGYALVGARKSSVEAMAPIMAEDLTKKHELMVRAVGTAQEQETKEAFMHDLTAIAGRYDAMANVAPENAEVMAKEVLSLALPNPSSADGMQPITVKQMIEGSRTNDDFQNRRREYQQSLEAQARGGLDPSTGRPPSMGG